MKRLPAAASWTGWIALAVLIFFGLRRVTFEVDITALLPPSIPETNALRQILKNSSQRDEVIVLLEGQTKEATEAALAGIEAALRARPDVATEVMTRAAIRTDMDEKEAVAAGEVAAEVLGAAWLNQSAEKWTALEQSMSAEKVEPFLTARIEEMATSLDMAESMAGYDPFGLLSVTGDHLSGGIGNVTGGFASKDGKSRIFFVHAKETPKNYIDSQRWLDALHGVMDPVMAKYPGVTLAITGNAAFEAEGGKAMQGDMLGSGLGSLLLTAGLFFLFYRRLRPLLLVVLALIIITAVTLAIGGIVLPGMNIMTAGFAGILIGLTIDYGILVYQESLENTDAQGVRNGIVRSIACAAGTTVAAFIALGVCTIPGISQLGIITGIGITVGAIFMSGPYCSWVFRGKNRPRSESGTTAMAWLRPARSGRMLAIFAGVVCAAGLAGLFRGLPHFDSSLKSVELVHSEARETLQRMSEVLSERADPMQYVISGPARSGPADAAVRETELNAIAAHLEGLRSVVEDAKAKGLLSSAALPAGLVPWPARQRENLPRAAKLAAEEARITAAVSASGFDTPALGLVTSVFRVWRKWAERGEVPVKLDSRQARWIMDRFLPSQADPPFAIGLVRPHGDPRALTRHLIASPREGVVLLSRETVADALAIAVPKEILPIGLALCGGVCFMLWLTFRSLNRILLCAGVMLLNLTVLFGWMNWLGLEWNFVNLGALLLVVGAGIDYSIHILLSLDRHGGDAGLVRSTTGRALMGCCLTTAAGFASLYNASIPGLASLGAICGLSLVVNLLIAAFLLPLVWRPGARSAAPELIKENPPG